MEDNKGKILEEKKKEIDNERKKLRKLFSDIPDSQKKLCEGLVDNASFLRVELKDLQEDIIVNGARIESMSGNGYKTLKDNPSIKALTGLTSQYNSTVKILINLLPEGTNEARDELMKFLYDN